jgi:predicted RNA-binding Zn ribbon-like protein
VTVSEERYEPEAPGDLGLVEAFVNTRDVETGTDLFDDVAVLGRWLNRHGLIGRQERVVAADDRGRAVAVREAFRDLLAANHDGEPIPDATRRTLDGAADRAGITLRFGGPGGSETAVTATGVDGAMGRLLAIAHAAMLDGSWERLKVCRSDTCQWAFYDHSRNRSRNWCSMQVCGNRTKVRRFRERH